MSKLSELSNAAFLLYGCVQTCNYCDNSGHWKPFSQGNCAFKSLLL